MRLDGAAARPTQRSRRSQVRRSTGAVSGTDADPAPAWGSLARFIMRMTTEVFGPDSAPPVVAMIAADKASHMTAAFSQTFRVPGLRLHRLPATWPLARIVAALNEIQPDSLQGYASVIHQLAAEALAGRLRIAPRIVGTTSEPLLPEIREAIAATWGAPLFNALGTTEGLMGVSCSAGRGIHLNDDVCIVGMEVTRCG